MCSRLPKLLRSAFVLRWNRQVALILERLIVVFEVEVSLRLLLVFAITEFLLCLTPGPAVLLVVSQSVRSGFKSSLRATAGILTGNAIYFALSALGLGALLLSSALLFQIIKWVGVLYLVFIGLKMLLAKKDRQTRMCLQLRQNAP